MESNIEISIFLLEYTKNLKNCIKTLFSQSLNEIEIFYVNNSIHEEISDIMKNDHVEFIKIPDKNNVISLNHIMSKATGKYVFFVDQNNFFKKESFETFYTISEKNKLDLLIPINKNNNFYNYRVNINLQKKNCLFNDDFEAMNSKEILFEDLLNFDLNYKNKLIDKKLITKFLNQDDIEHSLENMMLYVFFTSKKMLFIDDYLISSFKIQNKKFNDNNDVLFKFKLYHFIFYHIIFSYADISKLSYYQYILSDIYCDYQNINKNCKKIYLIYIRRFLNEFVVLKTVIPYLNSEIRLFFKENIINRNKKKML